MKTNELLGLLIPGIILLPVIIFASAIFIKAMWIVLKSMK